MNRKIICRDCKRTLGEAREDEQYMRIGTSVDLWLRTKISCVCGAPYVWIPKVPPDAQTGEQLKIEKKIRNGLGEKLCME